MPPPHRRDAILLSNEIVGPALHVLTFEWPDADPVDFVPGQYVTFYLQRQGKQITRSYSFFSSPTVRDRFSLLVKKLPLGFGSTLLCELSPRAKTALTTLAPLGKFVVQDPGSRAVVLVATGTGLAPFVPMLERLKGEHPQSDTWLFFGVRFVAELVDFAELRSLERAWTSFHFVPVVSRPPGDGSWSGATGHVQEQVRTQFPDLSQADVYLCGVNEMVNEMREIALETGCPKERVFVERYGEDAEPEVPPASPIAPSS